MAIKHSRQTTLPDNPEYDVSASEWNAAHSVEDATILPQHLSEAYLPAAAFLAAGSNTDIQWNNNGAFGGGGPTWDGVKVTLPSALISDLTASKVVFTDANSKLTSTGIGLSGQFIKGDGSLDSSTYLGDAPSDGTKYVRQGGLWVGPSAVRELLFADRTYYIRTDGSDSNTGMVDTAGGAFRTLQGAYDVIAATLDFASKTVTIKISVDGTYGPLLISVPWVGGGYVSIVGNIGDMSAVVIDGGGTGSAIFVLCSILGIITIDYVKLTSQNDCGLSVGGSGIAIIKHVDFGVCGYCHMAVTLGGAYIWILNDYTISGGGYFHLLCQTGGQIYLDGYTNGALTVTLSGAPDFSVAFANSNTLGVMYITGNTTWAGSATGKRYDVIKNAVIDVEGSATTWLPGNVSGTSATGGQYV